MVNVYNMTDLKKAIKEYGYMSSYFFTDAYLKNKVSDTYISNHKKFLGALDRLGATNTVDDKVIVTYARVATLTKSLLERHTTRLNTCVFNATPHLPMYDKTPENYITYVVVPDFFAKFTNKTDFGKISYVLREVAKATHAKDYELTLDDADYFDYDFMLDANGTIRNPGQSVDVFIDKNTSIIDQLSAVHSEYETLEQLRSEYISDKQNELNGVLEAISTANSSIYYEGKAVDDCQAALKTAESDTVKNILNKKIKSYQSKISEKKINLEINQGWSEKLKEYIGTYSITPHDALQDYNPEF